MQTFVYRASFEPGAKRGRIVVSFPDVPEAITEGRDDDDARLKAEEALGLALLSYPERGLALPKPKARGGNLVAIAVDPDTAAKLALLAAWASAKISKSEFARRVGCDEKEARRLLDPKHPSKLANIQGALRKLGQRLIIAVEAA
jgi:antitoxin HicB